LVLSTTINHLEENENPWELYGLIMPGKDGNKP
jgi:hypothetical protein